MSAKLIQFGTEARSKMLKGINDRGDELEVRFGTKDWNPITKIDFNNVISKLKSTYTDAGMQIII